MGNILKIRRGDEYVIPALAKGELGFSTDTKKTYIGDSSSNHRISMHNDYDIAHSIMRATTAENPEAIQIGSDKLIGRNGAGDIDGISPSDILDMLSGEAVSAFSLNSNRITSMADPSNSQDAATKNYVDNLAAHNLTAHEAVDDKDILDPSSLSPSTGDRYWIAGTGAGDWSGHDYEIAEWNGSSWQYDDVTDGDFAFVADESIFYYYDADAGTLKKLNTGIGTHAGTHEDGGNDEVDHDKLKGFVGNEHINHSNVQITGANLLSGQGGDLTANRTFDLKNGDIDHDSLDNYVSSKHIDHSNLNIDAGIGLIGGGDITLSRTIDLDLHSLSTMSSPHDDDYIPIVDVSDSDKQKKVKLSDVYSISIEDNPTDGASKIAISSNWAYDHENSYQEHGTSSNIVGKDDTQTLTNKTIDDSVIDCGTW